MIRKRKGKYVVLSHDGKRSFGEYETEAQAKKRLAQVHYFKHLHEDKGQVNCMDITKVLSYLKEELKDIPAVSGNIHYTSLESLYYILQSGLKGQLGGYKIRTPKTKKDDMELSTVRNSHKITQDEKNSLSDGAGSDEVKIELFTDRILAAHRGTRKAPLAELPISHKKYLERKKEEFKQHYGIEPPQLFKTEDALKKPNVAASMYDAREWVDENIKTADLRLKERAIDDVYWYNKYLKEYYNFLSKREREERFILKSNIPVNPDFMKIIITADKEWFAAWEEEFLSEVAENYLKLIDKHYEVFVDNKKFREFRNYLRYLVKGQNQ